MLKSDRFWRGLVVAMLAFQLWPAAPARAHAACIVVIAPSQVPSSQEVVLDLQITNTGDESLQWLQVERPTSNYEINGITISDWQESTNENGTTLYGSQLDPSQDLSFQLAMFTGPLPEPPVDWVVLVSAQPDGSDAVLCTGSTQTEILAPSDEATPGGVTDIGLTSITPTSAEISWTSDEATTSYVYFGTTPGYGQVASAIGSNTSHRVRLSGLAPDTLYHYQVSGTTTGGEVLTSGNNTFITPQQPTAPTGNVPSVTTPSGQSNGTLPGSALLAEPKETVAPTVKLTSNVPKVTSELPAIRGEATDNVAINRLEYSTDGGTNWLPVISANVMSPARISFEFTPQLTEDGNYTIVVRATDTSANIGTSTPVVLVIDKLSPQAGQMVISYGPHVLQPESSGLMHLTAGTTYQVTTSVIGGPVSVGFELVKKGPEQVSGRSSVLPAALFSATQSQIDGLWRASISAPQAGSYQLVARTLDGAGNIGDRSVAAIVVSPPGTIVSQSSSNPIKKASVEIFVHEPNSREWQPWQSSSYGLDNPIAASDQGQFNLMLPAGRYYLSVKAPGYQEFISDSFVIDQPMAIAPVIKLSPTPVWRIGGLEVKFYWPTLSSQRLHQMIPVHRADQAAKIVGQYLPNVTTTTIDGSTKSTAGFIGKPTVYCLLTTWSTGAQAQIATLAQIQSNTDVNVVPVFVQQSPGLVNAYLSSAQLSLSGIADKDGILSGSLGASMGPQHIFVSRSGVIKHMRIGGLSEQEILNELGGI